MVDFFNGGMLSQGGLVIGLVFMIFLFVAVIGVVVWYFYRQSLFKQSVIIHKANSEGQITGEYPDKAKIIRRDGKNLLQLRKFKEIISNPGSEFQVPKANGGFVLYFRWDGGHAFQPQRLAYNSPLTFTPGQYNMLQQMTIRQREANKRHMQKSFWAEYGHIVGWMIFVVLTSITLWILFSKLELVATGINNLANSLREVRQVVG